MRTIMKRKTLIGGALMLGFLSALQTPAAFAGGDHDQHKQSSTSSQKSDSKPASPPQETSSPKMNHGDMDHGSMDHGGMDHDKMKRDPKATDAEVDSNHDH